MIKTENQLRFFLWQKEQRLVPERWTLGLCTAYRRNDAISVGQKEFSHFTQWDINNKYNIISHKKLNFYDKKTFNQSVVLCACTHFVIAYTLQ